mmetsp:Transcript_722/g.1317  ORF Transcript_722/g.1317 Transcript_722/m.1317 type:complete len:236 (+) Transcript_722:124-831(+)
MRNLAAEASLIDSSDRVSTANNSCSSTLLGCVGQHLGDCICSVSEMGHFENAHWSVPDNCLALVNLTLEFVKGVRTNIQAHPVTRDLVDFCNSSVGVIVEFIGQHDIGRQKNLYSHLFCLLHQVGGSLNQIVFNQRGSNIVSQCFVEGEDHSSSDQNRVTFFQKALNHWNLCRNLGTTNNRHHWLLWVVNGTLQVFELLIQQVSSSRQFHVLGDTLGTGVCSVGSTECIHHEVVS